MRFLLSVLNLCLDQVIRQLSAVFLWLTEKSAAGTLKCLSQSSVVDRSELPEIKALNILTEGWMTSNKPHERSKDRQGRGLEGTERIHLFVHGVTRASRFFFRWISADRADQFLPRWGVLSNTFFKGPNRSQGRRI